MQIVDGNLVYSATDLVRVFRLLEMCTDSGEGMGRFRSVAAEGGCDVWFAGQSEEADGEVAQPGHNLRCGAGSYLRAVFIQGHIPYPAAESKKSHKHRFLRRPKLMEGIA